MGGILSQSDKKGYPIQFEFNSLAMQAMLESRAAWTHNWNDHISNDFEKPCILKDINFCPSLWNQKYRFKPELYKKKPKFVLGFNEPDKKSQSNLPVDVALSEWSRITKDIPQDILLVGPACSDDSKGQHWTAEFYTRALNHTLRFDALGLHLYRNDLHGYAKNHIPQLCDKFQKPVVISEFAYINWHSSLKDWHDKDFLNKAIRETMKFVEWCEMSNLVKGYCIFADYNDHLNARDDYKYAWKMISQGYLTELYKHYREI